MIHSFTVTFGAKYLTDMVTSVPPYETFSLIKNNVLHQSKTYKNHFKNVWTYTLNLTTMVNSVLTFMMNGINFTNIPASPAYGVYISQLIRYARASRNYSDFLIRHLYLRNRLLDQGY
jgi:hypothetical protein